MPVIQGRTRKEIRQSIGYNLGAMHIGTATGSGSTTTIVDTSLTTVIGGNDDHIGKWIVFTSGSNDGDVARVTDYVASTTTLTFAASAGVTVSANTAANDTYELWDGDFPPTRIHDFINQSIIEATGQVYDPVENLSLHTDGHDLRFDIPSGVSMIQDIYYRDRVEFTRLHACATTFDEVVTPTGFTQELDTEDTKQGTQSLKISFAVGAQAGAFIADSITAKDISGYDTIEMWVKVSGIGSALQAGNLKLHLDNGTVTADGEDKESLNIPGVSPDTWTFVRMSLGNPESDGAIASIGLEHDADLGADVTVWIDDIVAVANDTAEWTILDRRNWKIDKESRDLVLQREGHKAVGYSLIKITGGDKPALMTANTDTSEIDENYVIAQTVSLALLASSGGPATDPDAKRQISAFWTDQAQRARRTFPMLVNVRSVD